MKKQILAAAVAAVIATPAMAGISITGNAKFEYTHTNVELNGADASVNGTETEINLKFKGTSGDTSVYANLEIDSQGNTEDGGLDIEDTYLTTKIGPVNVKAGNFASSTSALLGEIDNGSRANDKFVLSYAMDGIKVYAGNSGTRGDDTPINNNMFAGVVATAAGWKLELKKNNENKNSFGINGKVGPVNVRAELSDSDIDKDNGYFVDLNADIAGITVGYAMAEMDANGGITEDDSSIFALSNDSAGNSNSQLYASMTLDGTEYSAKLGTIGFDGAQTDTDGTDTIIASDDVEYFELYGKRKLASGATLKVSYLNADYGTVNINGTDADTESQEFEIDLSVKF